MNDFTHQSNMEPLQEVKEEVPDEGEVIQSKEQNNKENEPISEASTSEKDSSMIKFYDELLLTKKHNFLLEQRIQKIEKRPADAENMLKVSEETIRAACHYMREQSGIIEAQAQRIKEYETKEKQNEADVKVELAKFGEILENMTAREKIKEDLKEIKEKVEKNGKMHYSDFKKIRIEVEKVSKALNNSSERNEILDFKNHVKEVQTQLNKITELLDSPSGNHDELKGVKNQLDVIQKTNNDALKQFGKIQHEENKIVRIEITKLSEIIDKNSKFYEKEMESLKEEIQTNKDEAEDIQKTRHDALEKMMKDQLSMFMEDFKKQTNHHIAIPRKEQRKRPATNTFTNPPAKKQAYVSKVKTESVENKETKCIFCNVFGHKSVKCTRFPTAYQRKMKLEERKICIRCLEPNNVLERNEHSPCPKADVECPNCVDKWPGDEFLTNHHPLVCNVNALPPSRPEHLHLPRRNPDKIYCIFCHIAGHDSVDCRRFSSSLQRRMKLRQRKICLRCLQPNNIEDGREHDPCPNADKPCPNCVDEYPGIKDITDHHLLVCARIPSPHMLQEMNEDSDE